MVEMVGARRWGGGPLGTRSLTRVDLAQFLGQRPGRGSFWGDDGASFRVMLDPEQEIRSSSLDDLSRLAWPQGSVGDQGVGETRGELWAGWCGYDVCTQDLRRRLEVGWRPQAPRAEVERAAPRARWGQVGMRAYRGELRGGPDGSIEVRGELPWLAELLRFLDKSGARTARPKELQSWKWPFAPLRALWTPQRYQRAFDAVQEYLRAGDSYQVNLSQAFAADFLESRLAPERVWIESANVFAYLCEHRPGDFGALVETDPGQSIVSNSPELLFRVDALAETQEDRLRIITGPIKGTRPRGATPDVDQSFAQALVDSEKDAAEHRMIVDLLRNDLGRIAIPGSVSAPQYPTLITLPTVFHLVSRIEARLEPEVSMLGLWRALAPGGSITGAPKLRTVQIIEELEAEPRGIYCGSIFVSDRRSLLANIAIRSAEIGPRGMYLRSGGGIVADSQWRAEYQETLDKARAFQGMCGVQAPR